MSWACPRRVWGEEPAHNINHYFLLSSFFFSSRLGHTLGIHSHSYSCGRCSPVPQPSRGLTDLKSCPLQPGSHLRQQGVAQLNIPLCGVVGCACLFSTMQGPPLSMLGWEHHPCYQLTSTSGGLSSQCASRWFLNVFTAPLFTAS